MNIKIQDILNPSIKQRADKLKNCSNEATAGKLEIYKRYKNLDEATRLAEEENNKTAQRLEAKEQNLNIMIAQTIETIELGAQQ